MKGIGLAIQRSVLACKLEHAAIGRDEETAAALRRAAAKYRAGVHMALADTMREVDGERWTLAERVERSGLIQSAPADSDGLAGRPRAAGERPAR